MAESGSDAHNRDVISYPTSDNFDQKTAKRLVKECSTLIIEDIPIGTEFGIDLNVYNIGQKFLGLKMIGSGIHFIYYSSVSKDGSVGPRTAFFRYFKSRELIVRKWNQMNEEIEECNDLKRLERYSDNVRNGSVDPYLGAYQFSTYSDWVGLTDYITESLFDRLNPRSGQISSVRRLIRIGDHKAVDSEGLPIMEIEPNSVINFSQIPKRFLYPSDATATQISRHSMDSSFTLESIISKLERIEDILGELQFAFVTFIFGHVFESFEFWKQLLKILCFSEDSVIKYSDLYINFIRVLHFQLKKFSICDDLFVESNNFLVIFLTNFFSNIKSNPNVNQILKKRSERFEEFLSKNFKWDFSSELEDEAPIVVDL